MKEPDFQIDDIIQIRDWDDMVEEFGINDDGDILCPFVFTRGMREHCGDHFQVMSIREGITSYPEGRKSLTDWLYKLKHLDSKKTLMWNFSEASFEGRGLKKERTDVVEAIQNTFIPKEKFKDAV